jgi:hypothetical protein
MLNVGLNLSINGKRITKEPVPILSAKIANMHIQKSRQEAYQQSPISELSVAKPCQIELIRSPEKLQALNRDARDATQTTRTVEVQTDLRMKDIAEISEQTEEDIMFDTTENLLDKSISDSASISTVATKKTAQPNNAVECSISLIKQNKENITEKDELSELAIENQSVCKPTEQFQSLSLIIDANHKESEKDSKDFIKEKKENNSTLKPSILLPISEIEQELAAEENEINETLSYYKQQNVKSYKEAWLNKIQIEKYPSSILDRTFSEAPHKKYIEAQRETTNSKASTKRAENLKTIKENIEIKQHRKLKEILDVIPSSSDESDLKSKRETVESKIQQNTTANTANYLANSYSTMELIQQLTQLSFQPDSTQNKVITTKNELPNSSISFDELLLPTDSRVKSSTNEESQDLTNVTKDAIGPSAREEDKSDSAYNKSRLKSVLETEDDDVALNLHQHRNIISLPEEALEIDVHEVKKQLNEELANPIVVASPNRESRNDKSQAMADQKVSTSKNSLLFEYIRSRLNSNASSSSSKYLQLSEMASISIRSEPAIIQSKEIEKQKRKTIYIRSIHLGLIDYYFFKVKFKRLTDWLAIIFNKAGVELNYKKQRLCVYSDYETLADSALEEIVRSYKHMAYFLKVDFLTSKDKLNSFMEKIESEASFTRLFFHDDILHICSMLDSEFRRTAEEFEKNFNKIYNKKQLSCMIYDDKNFSLARVRVVKDSDFEKKEPDTTASSQTAAYDASEEISTEAICNDRSQGLNDTRSLSPKQIERSSYPNELDTILYLPQQVISKNVDDSTKINNNPQLDEADSQEPTEENKLNTTSDWSDKSDSNEQSSFKLKFDEAFSARKNKRLLSWPVTSSKTKPNTLVKKKRSIISKNNFI